MLKYKYIFQIKYTEATFIKQNSELSGFEITKLIFVVQEEKLLSFIIIFGTLSFPVLNVQEKDSSSSTHGHL